MSAHGQLRTRAYGGHMMGMTEAASNSMTRSELIKNIALEHELPDAVAKLAITTIFDDIITALEQGRRVEIRGFGSFSPRHYAPRTARNPRTGEPVDVPPKTRAMFRAGLGLRQRLSRAYNALPRQRKNQAKKG